MWGLWKQNINPEWIAASGYVLCWAAKWHGEEEIFYKRIRNGKPISLLEPIHRLLSEADAVVHYNGSAFDIPTLQKEFITHGMKPPSPYKQIDLLRTMRDQFRFPSNKLDYIAQTLGVGAKLRHKGAELWLDCMAGKAEAWASMEAYNKQDVVLLERLYDKLLPWITRHPNHGTHDGVAKCPKCGSEDFQQRGYAITTMLKYRRYKCSSCGGWFRGNKSVSLRIEERHANIV